jgi:exopolyphosphatase / guanosine-5'-triphosphate,3'-diphosphate pyrophosphatase
MPPFPGLGRPNRLGAVDIGSNTCSMILVGSDGGRYRVLEDYSVVTGLGRERGPHGELHPPAVERTLLTLRMFRRRFEEMDATRVTCAATAAVREAPARDAFLRLIQRHAGLDVDVLSGDDEAAVTFLSAARDFGQARPLVLVDVGGASTEVARGLDEMLEASVSVRLGAVRCSEEFLGSRSPPLPADLDALRAAVREALPGGDHADATVVAVGGTPTTLLAVRDRIFPYDAARIHGRSLTAREIDESSRRLASLDLPALEALSGMQSGRAPYLVAGLTILGEVMRVLRSERIIVSDRGLRFGLLYRAFEELRGPV